MAAWRGKCRSDLKVEDFKNDPCWMAIDIASKVDLAARVKLFRRAGHYYVFAHHYLPGDVVEEHIVDNCERYAAWAKDGLIELTEGTATDIDTIEKHVLDDVQEWRPSGVAYDPWNAEQLRQHLEKAGVPMVECRQGFQQMSEPMATLDSLIRAGKIHHNGDPVLSWCMGNVIGKQGPNDAVRPDKERVENKIDPAVALIMALGLAIRTKEESNNCGVLVF